MNIDFKRGPACPITNTRPPNEVLVSGDFHISYKASVADYGCDTTAIVLKDHVFLILNGDHRQVLSEALKTNGIQGCIDYFVQNINMASKYSEHRIMAALVGDKYNILKVAVEVIGQANIDKIKAAINEPA